MKGFPGVHFHRKVGELFRSLQLSSFFCHGERAEGGGGGTRRVNCDLLLYPFVVPGT